MEGFLFAPTLLGAPGLRAGTRRALFACSAFVRKALARRERAINAVAAPRFMAAHF
jgi:hypothetical protein